MILLLLITACRNKNSEKSVEATELPSLSYTIYTDNTELFAEFRTPIPGDTIKLAGHFTHIGEVFSAINEGSITLTLVVDDKSVSQTSTVSSSPGIFRYAIVPPEEGLGKMIFDIITPKYTDQIIIDSIIVYSDAIAAQTSQIEEQKGNVISYLKEQAWKVEFANMAVKTQPFSEVIKTTGIILPAQGDEIVVISNTNGIVSITGNKAIIGTPVNKGEVLFTVSGGSLSDGNSETRFIQAKTSYEKASADYYQALELIKDNIISQKEFREIKARFESEQANFNNLGRNYKDGGQRVLAPISGFVKSLIVTEGQYVSVGDPLAIVSRNQSLILKADVSQKYFLKLPAITSANFKSATDNKTYSIESLNGRLLSYGRSNDASTLFIPVTFSFDSQAGIVPGSLVEVFLKLKSAESAILIPQSALIEEQGSFYAYVQTAGESFEKRELVLGGTNGIDVQVLSGLEEDERVVTKGAYQIKLATASGTIPAHGHAH